MTRDSSARTALYWSVPLVVLGMIAREIVCYITWGSHDATQFQEFGRQVALHGILHLYRTDVMYNHPPALGYVCAIVYRLTHARLDVPDVKSARHLGFTFPFLFKQINVIADIVTCWLLWKILRARFDSRLRGSVHEKDPGLREYAQTPASEGTPEDPDRSRNSATWAGIAVVLFAWSPTSIILTGYQGNDDPVYAMLCLLTVYLIEDRKRDFWGGVALAAAINVKLIPILLILPLLMQYRDRARALRFVAGLSLGVIPFIPVLIAIGPLFYHNVLKYGSAIDNWGVMQFLLATRREPRFSVSAQIMIDRYYTAGRWMIIAAIVLLSMHVRRNPKISRYLSTACALSLFLILTPGWGLQYLIIPLPLLYATARFIPATIYSLLCGILCFFTAYQNWFGSWPIDSDTIIGPVTPGPLYALLAWATLIVFVFTTLRDSRETAHG